MTESEPGLSVLGKLSLAIDGLTGKIDGWQREYERQRKAWRPATPADIHLSGTAIVGTGLFPSGRAIVSLSTPSPDEGFVWVLRALTIARGDADLTTTLHGTAWVFVGAPPPYAQLALLLPTGLRAAQTSLPATSTWTSRQITVKANELFFVVITGGTNSEVAYIEASFEQEPDAASPQVWAL